MEQPLVSNEVIKNSMIAAYQEALKSPDPSSQNGAVLFDPWDEEILTKAHNTFPDGIEITQARLLDKPLKYRLIDHAESGVLLKAHRQKIFKSYDPENLWLICPWAACCGCAKYIIGFGIKKVIAHKQAMALNHGHWIEECEVSLNMFKEAGVEYVYFDYPNISPPILRDGKLTTF